jgi:hypothetical protein
VRGGEVANKRAYHDVVDAAVLLHGSVGFLIVVIVAAPTIVCTVCTAVAVVGIRGC